MSGSLRNSPMTISALKAEKLREPRCACNGIFLWSTCLSLKALGTLLEPAPMFTCPFIHVQVHSMDALSSAMINTLGRDRDKVSG